MELTLTVLDTTGIQSYIFGSNRLRENIGASHLVTQVTNPWVRQELINMGISNPEGSIEDQDAELVYAGGGNTVLLFKSLDLAIEFTKRLSLKVLKEAPGVNLVVAHNDKFVWNQDKLYDTVQNMMKYDLDTKKRARIPSSPLLGLGVTQDCNSTRLVAVDRSSNIQNSPGNYPVSRDIVAKLAAVPAANEDLKQIIFDPKIPNLWEVRREFDDFGRSEGEMSYIAVVHIDGNSMGDRFKIYAEGKNDRDYISAMRSLSASVEAAGKNVLKQLTEELIDAWEKLQASIDLKSQTIPFRPLVYGGDDITFVCDGRLGLSLAVRCLQLLEKQPIADGKPLTACAGVCIVKAHYPFARAYEMSESLCQSAKKVAKHERLAKDIRSESVSAIDWHIATSGLLGSISEIRQREYCSQKGKPLEMRPLLLHTDPDDWQNWENFESIINKFETDLWKGKRNKVKALREVLRRDKDATKEFLTSYQLKELPKIAATGFDTEMLAKQGWLNDVCGYFDAIEAIDFYLPLGGDV